MGEGRCMRHKRLTLHQKQWCVHASANDSSVQQSASSRHSTGGETASASQNGGVSPASPEESVAKGTKTDTATHDVNGVSNVEKAAKKSAVAHQVRLTKASDWHQEAAEEEAYTKWVPLVQEKQRELPLVAVVGLTAGGLVLAIVLFLQGWNKMQHRVPALPRLPFSTHKPHQEAKREELGVREKGRMEAEPQGTQGPSASLSSLPSLHTEKKTDTATAEPAETAQVAKEEKSSGVGKSVVQKVSALIPGLKHKKEEDKKEKEKKGTEMEEDRIAEEKEVAKMEDAEKEHDSTDKNQGGEGESETKPADADRDPHSEKSLVSEGETTKDRDSERQSLIEKPDILMSPIDLTDSAKAEHPSEKGPVQLRQDEAVQQHQVEKPDAAPTRAAEKHPAPVVLEPAVNVVALRGGDGRRAPPSSPALMGGASPTAVEDNKGAVPAGILKAAADMLRAKELPDLDGGEDATPESVAKTGEGVSEEKAEVVGNDGGSESEAGEIHGGDKKDQSFLEGLTDSLASLVQDSPTEQSESRMELHGGKSGSGEQEGGDAKALALPPLPSPTPSVSSPEEATPAQDDERRPSLAGGEGATAKQPPARGEPAVSGGESFQDWYAKQKSGAGKKDLSASNKRPTGDMKPSAYVDKTQLQALQALQKLSVVEQDVQPTAVCSRRHFARWLLSGSSVLTGTPGVHPVPSDGVTDTAFDDVTFDDGDFAAIQGLAEAGIIPSRLSHGSAASSDSQFQPDAPLTRQDLVRWKLALDRRRLPREADPEKAVLDSWGFVDAELVDPAALPAMIADFQAGDQSVIARAFGYTLRFQPHKPVSVAQAAAALAAGSASETVSERVSEMESYRAADEVFREEAREQREIIEAVAARGEEIVKQLEEDKGALAETRATVEEAIKELDAHREAIRAESEQLTQSVEQARSIIMELSSGRSVSETERNALQAELQKLEDQRVAIEAVTSEAELHIGAEIRKARAAVEGLEGAREALQSTNGEGSVSGQSAESGVANGKPLVEVFDERMELADERARNPLKHAVRVASAQMEVAKGHVARLSRRVRSDGADVMGSLRVKTGHVAAAGSEFVRDVPQKVRETVPWHVQERMRSTTERVRERVERLLLLAWQTLLRVWYLVEGALRAGIERAKSVLARVQKRGGPHRSSHASSN